MATRERAQRTAGAGGASSAGTRRLPRLWTVAGSLAVAAAVYVAAASSTVGRVAYTFTFYFMHFYAGVFILMGLTGTVIFGLVATDRIVLNPRLRVWMQAIHRCMALFSMAFLAVHVWTKATGGTITLFNAFVPFTNPGATTNLYLGLGPVSGYLMLFLFWTGIARAVFADRWSPRVWRLLHSVAYLTWPLALLHGLGAGRRPATWVTASYLLCVLAVTAALLLRLATNRGRQQERGRVARPALAIDAEGRQVRAVDATPARGRATPPERATNPLEERWAKSAESWAANAHTLVPATQPEEDAEDEDEPPAPAEPAARSAARIAAAQAAARSAAKAAARRAALAAVPVGRATPQVRAADARFVADLDARFAGRPGEDRDEDDFADEFDDDAPGSGADFAGREQARGARAAYDEDEFEDEEFAEDDDVDEVDAAYDGEYPGDGEYAEDRRDAWYEEETTEVDWLDRASGGVRRAAADEAAYQPRRLREYEPRRAAREDSRAAARSAIAAREAEREFVVDFDGDAAPEGEFGWMEPDETPTLVDLANRRARRAERAGTGRNRPRYRASDEEYDDEAYEMSWREAR
ncbi:hypothetical protein GCM10010124_40960 [Pilimelia terevasa]|uniref:Uncharacterized protein n=1 Tax=Pilimelia terevasa TaxID=53372 RepID=A0A8J3FKA4_9ACTN|nr:ferric reductase-like transmembrane domain-containing protein [Pilimelia terevasa]GGK43923.1 hypothetical protein GCM10010124_40960 [Pilimelia terevasa]